MGSRAVAGWRLYLETRVTGAGKEVTLHLKGLSPIQQRKVFIDEYLKRQDNVSELCRRFAVSRETAYKWIDRFFAGCGLVDRSRRPHSSPTVRVGHMGNRATARER